MRIAARPPKNYPFYLRPFFASQRRKYGAVLDSALLWARSPKLFLGVALLYGAIDRKGSPIEPVLRSLLTVRVSQINGCSFCIDLNSATLLKRGVPPSKVEALANWRVSNLFDVRECDALDYAEAMTRSEFATASPARSCSTAARRPMSSTTRAATASPSPAARRAPSSISSRAARWAVG